MIATPLTVVRNRRRSDDGFTLIELLVVVVILGILIGIAIPVYLNYRKSANDKTAQSDVRNTVSTLEVCFSEGGYPTQLSSTGGSLAPYNCTQTITLSSGTTIRYTPVSTATGSTSSITFYVLVGTNSGGSGKFYCYNSASGGSVVSATSPRSGMTLGNANC